MAMPEAGESLPLKLAPTVQRGEANPALAHFDALSLSRKLEIFA